MKNLPYWTTAIGCCLLIWISWTLSYQLNLPRMDETTFNVVIHTLYLISISIMITIVSAIFAVLLGSAIYYKLKKEIQ